MAELSFWWPVQDSGPSWRGYEPLETINRDNGTAALQARRLITNPFSLFATRSGSGHQR